MSELKEKNKLAKLKLITLVAVVLVSCSLLSTCAARPPQLVAVFAARASGECLVIDLFSNHTSPVIAVGTGSLNYAGSSMVASLAPGSPTATALNLIETPGLYQTTRLLRPYQKTITVNWNETSLTVTFVPKDRDNALFGDNITFGDSEYGDLIAAGAFFGDDANLQFKATIVDDSGKHLRSGYGGLISIPTEFDGKNGLEIVAILYDQSGNLLFELAWFSEDVELEYMSIAELITISAADTIESTVQVYDQH